MKAIVQERYGSPDNLELREVEKPMVGEDGVLVCAPGNWRCLLPEDY